MQRSKSVSYLTDIAVKARRFFYFCGLKDCVHGIPFVKLNAYGNDFIFIKEKNISVINDINGFAETVCDRNNGIGADGLIVIGRCKTADFRITIYNSDGSHAQICGNGIFCTARLLYENGLLFGDEFTLMTDAGIKIITLITDKGSLTGVSINMGSPIFDTESLPAVVKANPFISKELDVNGVTFHATLLSMGNPHCVLFFGEVDSDELLEYCKQIAGLKIFPEGINVELCQIIDRKTIRMRVIERGVGLTRACGTGACAAAAAAMINELCDNQTEIRMDGGNVTVHIDNETDMIKLTGNSELVAEGKIFKKNHEGDSA